MQTEVELGFSQGFDWTWTSYGLIEVKKQTSVLEQIRWDWSRTEKVKIRFMNVICYCFVEGLKFRMNMKEFLILFVMHEKAKYFYMTKFYKGV